MRTKDEAWARALAKLPFGQLCGRYASAAAIVSRTNGRVTRAERVRWDIRVMAARELLDIAGELRLRTAVMSEEKLAIWHAHALSDARRIGAANATVILNACAAESRHRTRLEYPVGM